jgi:hypothetical protein
MRQEQKKIHNAQQRGRSRHTLNEVICSCGPYDGIIIADSRQGKFVTEFTKYILD